MPPEPEPRFFASPADLARWFDEHAATATELLLGYWKKGRPAHSDPPAWEFFTGQQPSYRRAAIWWVVSAKRQETRDRRLRQLVEVSRAGRRLPALTRP